MMYANIEERSRSSSISLDRNQNPHNTRYLISMIIGGLETIVSLLQVFHPLGFIFGVLLLIYGILGKFYVNEPTKNPEKHYFIRKGEDVKLINTLAFILRQANSVLIVVTSLLLLIGISNLMIDRNFDTFPSQCLPEPGCSRVSSEFNHRDFLVDPSDVITISGVEEETIHSELLYCIKKDQGGRILSDTTSADVGNPFIHTVFISRFFGFIDDMYLQIIKCNSKKFGIEVQSQLRIGESDFDVNPQRVADMYGCIGSRFRKQNIASTSKVCG